MLGLAVEVATFWCTLRQNVEISPNLATSTLDSPCSLFSAVVANALAELVL